MEEIVRYARAFVKLPITVCYLYCNKEGKYYWDLKEFQGRFDTIREAVTAIMQQSWFVNIELF